MAKFLFTVSTRYVGSKVEEEVEIADNFLEGLDEMEKEEVVEEYYKDWVTENIDGHWEELDE
ncbi:DUF7167 family protein [Paraliobacillus ryukyuensis]|uniref:DUF7167 family protein n=1 Tax=Paraliobacillus ryukyuensis TaxID=200904 RepID=UPI0009A89D8F|nr:hypothetical protein [Paraliobacillus ryukyuensis]